MISAEHQEETSLMQLDHMPLTKFTSTSRILEIPCKVCGDYSSGKHYNIYACDGCAGFFKRSIRRNRQYVCKAKDEGTCIIDKTHRNQCRACRLQKCQEAGMNKDAVQHERGPRSSTVRRQQMSFLNEVRDRMLEASSTGVMGYPKHPYPMIPPGAIICNPIMGMPRLPVLAVPTMLPPSVTSESIYEGAARLLFMNIQWLQELPSFRGLPFSDQLLLLEEGWRELFILRCVELLPMHDLTPLVSACGISQGDERFAMFLKNVQQFQEILFNLGQFRLDDQEFSFLRAIALFKTSFEKPLSFNGSTANGDTPGLVEVTKIATIQNQTQLALTKYITTNRPGHPMRFGKLMMLLPALKNVTCRTIEDLFFRRTIGNIPLTKIICDMYKTHAQVS